MDATMFIVKANGIFHGPFLKDSAEHFAEKAGSASEIYPLRLPQGANEQQQTPAIRVVSNEDYRSAHDEVTVETLTIIAGVTQSCWRSPKTDHLCALKIDQGWSREIGLPARPV